jgi:YgiT-type zinc finger domain-containing protein
MPHSPRPASVGITNVVDTLIRIKKCALAGRVRLTNNIEQTGVMNTLKINVCPICGSKRIRRVIRDVKSRRGGADYTARRIEVEECPDCGEQLFSPEALRRIADQRPRRRVQTASG